MAGRMLTRLSKGDRLRIEQPVEIRLVSISRGKVEIELVGRGGERVMCYRVSNDRGESATQQIEGV